MHRNTCWAKPLHLLIPFADKLLPDHLEVFSGGASCPGLLLSAGSDIFETTFAAALLAGGYDVNGTWSCGGNLWMCKG